MRQQRRKRPAMTGRHSRREVLRTLALSAPMALYARSVPRAAGTQTASRVEGTSKFHDVNGVKLHYLEWGVGSSSSLLVLHPGMLNARIWDAFGSAMARHYRVVAPDVRGFGDSQWSNTYSDDVFIDDIRALTTVLGLKRPILCGNSMGGTLAYSYASLHPQDVDRLIVVDTGPGEKPAEAGTPVAPAGARAGGPPPVAAGPFTTPEAAAAGVPAMFGAAFVKAMVQHNLKQAPDGRWHWKHDPAVMAAAEQSMRDPRKWPRWNAVKCPTLILRGERSPVLSQRIADQMIAENKNASLVVVPNAGHFIPIEQPAAFEAAVRTWLNLPG